MSRYVTLPVGWGGLGGLRPFSHHRKIEIFENFNFDFLGVKMNARDEFTVQNCTDTKFFGPCSSKES